MSGAPATEQCASPASYVTAASCKNSLQSEPLAMACNVSGTHRRHSTSPATRLPPADPATRCASSRQASWRCCATPGLRSACKSPRGWRMARPAHRRQPILLPSGGSIASTMGRPDRRTERGRTMKVRRCAVVFAEPREEVGFDLQELLNGGDGLRRDRRWVALAPHLGEEVEVDADERELLGALSPSQWIDARTLGAHPPAALRRLLKEGLLVGDGKRHAAHRA